MTSFSLIAKNTFYQIAGKIVSAGCGVLTIAILARYLGPSGLGDYITVTAYVLLFANLADWGLSIIASREAIKNKKDEETIFGNIVVIRLLLTVFALLTAVLLSFVAGYSSTVKTGIAVSGFALVFISIKTSAGMIFLAKEKLGLNAVSEAITGITTLLGTGFLIFLRAPLVLILAVFPTAYFFAAVFAVLSAKTLVSFNFKFDRQISKTIIKESLPMGALLLLSTIYTRIDIQLLNLLPLPAGQSPSAATGYYGLAYKFNDLLVIFAAYLMNAVFPSLTLALEKLKNGASFQGKKDLFILFRKIGLILAVTGISMAVIISFFAPIIIGLIAGDKFSPAIFSLRILIWATAISYLNHLTGYFLVAAGKQKMSVVIAFFCLFFNIVANLYAIPRWSFLGAAFITVMTEGLALGLTSYVTIGFLRKNFK
ncbi:MAG: flippase [bacterium]|nr:flippase [bacterium]